MGRRGACRSRPAFGARAWKEGSGDAKPCRGVRCPSCFDPCYCHSELQPLHRAGLVLDLSLYAPMHLCACVRARPKDARSACFREAHAATVGAAPGLRITPTGLRAIWKSSSQPPTPHISWQCRTGASLASIRSPIFAIGAFVRLWSAPRLSGVCTEHLGLRLGSPRPGGPVRCLLSLRLVAFSFQLHWLLRSSLWRRWPPPVTALSVPVLILRPAAASLAQVGSGQQQVAEAVGRRWGPSAGACG